MPSIAIIGGGIGGLTTAIALQQRGFDVSVYEAADEFRAVGSGIGLASNGMQVLDRLGIADRVAAAGTAIEQARFADVSGTVLGEFSFEPIAERFGYATTVLRRAKLQAALVERVPEDTLHVGRDCIDVGQDGDTVTATFDDGSEIIADLLIGADGIRSTVRDRLFPGAELRYSGDLSYRGIAGFSLPDPLEGTGVETWGRGCRFGFSPLEPETVYWFAVISAPPGDRFAPGDRREPLAEFFGAFGVPIPSIIRSTAEADIIHTDQYDLRPLDRWYADRSVLLGDAAHAATPDLGQGASQALEDAYVLADCLDQHEDHREAFAAYQHRRMPKAGLIAKRSRQWGTISQLENRILVALRNGLVRVLPGRVVRRQWERVSELDY